MCWVALSMHSLSDASYFTLRGAPRLFASAEFALFSYKSFLVQSQIHGCYLYKPLFYLLPIIIYFLMPPLICAFVIYYWGIEYTSEILTMITLFLNCTKLISSYFSSFSKRDTKFTHAVPECTGVYTQTASSPIWAIDSVVTQQENIFDMIPHHLIQG